MLRIQGLNKSFGKQILLEDASLQMTPGERLGLAGRNGHGKSTLFRMILGEEHQDSGDISYPKNYRIGHLAQHIHFTKPTVLEEGCTGLQPEDEHDHWKVEAILFGLGFTKEDMDRNPAEFSGGFQIRINLAKVLVSNPNLLLLDEPTNYLDIVSIRWITTFLRQWENELIIISHDREFMDSVTTHSAVIHRSKIRRVEGNTEKLYNLIATDEETYEKTRVNEEKQRKHAEAFINRFKAQANRASLVQSRIKMLDKLPKLEKLDTIADLDFNFHYAPFEAKTLMEISDLSFGYDPNEPLFSDLNLTIQAKDRIAIIGKNGKGKSTLLNVIAGELKPTEGMIRSHPKTQIGYFGQTNIGRLDARKTIEQEIDGANINLGRTVVRGICGLMMFSGDLAEKKVANLSGGEKSRVLLGKILAAPANLLLLDEPTNHLDMQSIEALMESIDNFEGASIIVTHSEEILRRLATKLVVFHHGGAELFLGDYDDFLNRVGWDDDESKSLAKKKSTSKTEKPGETRRERAELIAERSKILTPLKKEMDELEKEIFKLEDQVKKMNEELIVASQNKDTNKFVELSKQVKDNQKLIESKFEKLEKVSKEHQEQSAKYNLD